MKKHLTFLIILILILSLPTALPQQENTNNYAPGQLVVLIKESNPSDQEIQNILTNELDNIEITKIEKFHKYNLPPWKKTLHSTLQQKHKPSTTIK
jgi:hypothetical protein